MSAAFQSIWQLSRLLASGASTSVALVREHLDRIERLDGKLHAFVDVYADEALAAAEGLTVCAARACCSGRCTA